MENKKMEWTEPTLKKMDIEETALEGQPGNDGLDPTS